MSEALVTFAEIVSANLRIADHFISYNGRVLRFKFLSREYEQLKEVATTLSISLQFYENECEIELNEKYGNNVVIFFDDQDYLNRIHRYKNEFDSNKFLILLFNSGYAIKEINETYTPKKTLIFNILPYQNLIQFFSNDLDFITLHDTIKHQFIIFSGEKGPFYIGYNNIEEKVKNLPNLESELKKVTDYFSRIDFTQFFKEAVINGIHKESVDNRFFVMIQSLDVLLELANRDHRIYLKKFGFDKIKAKFKEERIKYFDSIEKNIDAVSKQVTSFPLTFAASIFAAYQVKDNSAILVLVLAAYALYTLIAWKILSITAFNRKSISIDMEAEALKIQNEYNVLFEEFKTDFQKIRDKLTKLKDLISILKLVLIGLLIAFAVFYLYETFFALKAVKAPAEVRIVK